VDGLVGEAVGGSLEKREHPISNDSSNRAQQRQILMEALYILSVKKVILLALHCAGRSQSFLIEK
jgi:hypothetical protein